MSILGCSWLPLPPCLPSFVSLHDLHSGLLLAAAAALSPFICLPSRSLFWAALGRRCRLVSLHLPPFMISILACCWVRLPPCLPSFVTLHSLLFVSQCWFLCPPPLASPFIAFHLSPSFFGKSSAVLHSKETRMPSWKKPRTFIRPDVVWWCGETMIHTLPMPISSWRSSSDFTFWATLQVTRNSVPEILTKPFFLVDFPRCAQGFLLWTRSDHLLSEQRAKRLDRFWHFFWQSSSAFGQRSIFRTARPRDETMCFQLKFWFRYFFVRQHCQILLVEKTAFNVF